MTLTDYIHHVLIEENPYIDCMDIADRLMTYEDAAVSIALDISDPEVKLTVDETVNYWLKTEFGAELKPNAVSHVIFRIKQMTSEELIHQGFNV